MKLFKSRREIYREAMRKAISDNSTAIFRALLHIERSSLDTQLAEFLLAEAGWSVEGFMTAVINGDV